MRRSSTLAYAQLSSDFGKLSIKIFKGGVYKNYTELSKYVCCIKHKNTDFKITWEVFKRAQPIADGNNPVCRLCLKESTAIVYALQKEGSLKKRSKFILYCWLMKKLLKKDNQFWSILYLLSSDFCTKFLYLTLFINYFILCFIFCITFASLFIKVFFIFNWISWELKLDESFIKHMFWYFQNRFFLINYSKVLQVCSVESELV